MLDIFIKYAIIMKTYLGEWTMKSLIAVLLCIVLFVGCASSSKKAIPEFEISTEDIISQVIDPNLERKNIIKLATCVNSQNQGTYSNGQSYVQKTYYFGSGGEVSFYESADTKIQRIVVTYDKLIAEPETESCYVGINAILQQYLEADLGFEMYQNVSGEKSYNTRIDYGVKSSICLITGERNSTWEYIPL